MHSSEEFEFMRAIEGKEDENDEEVEEDENDDIAVKIKTTEILKYIGGVKKN